MKIIWKEVKTETIYLMKGLLKRLIIDFGAVKTWVQIGLAALLACIYLFNQHTTEKKLDKAAKRADAATQAVARMKGSLQQHEKDYQQFSKTTSLELKILKVKDTSLTREVAVLKAQLRLAKIPKKDILRKIETMDNQELQQFFSTLKPE